MLSMPALLHRLSQHPGAAPEPAGRIPI